MELKDRFSILKQGAQVAQSKGVLSIDDAVIVKNAFNSIDSNQDLELALKILTTVVTNAQAKGCYTLKDAHIIYVALDGIEQQLNEVLQPTPETKEKDGKKKK